jgi:hypothetical protein
MSSMTDRDDDDFVLCGGGARPTDVHLASVVHCVNEEIVEWLKRRGTHRAGQMMSSVDGSRVARAKLTQWRWSGAVFCPAC